MHAHVLRGAATAMEGPGFVSGLGKVRRTLHLESKDGMETQ